MCGIAGFYSRDCDKTRIHDLVTDISNNLHHRGPDSWRWEIVGSYVIVHTRLVIRGDGEGNQPITTPTGRYVLTYNGEIYNLRELVDCLRSKDVEVPYPESDTHVLSLWIDKFGLKRISPIQGTFAFAVIDKVTDKIYLVRDRLGIKPLFFTSVQHEGMPRFIFASELGTIAKLLPSSIGISSQFISEYMWFGSGCSQQTIFEGVQSVAPGTLVEISDTSICASKWFDLLEEYQHAIDKKTDVDILIRNAVNRQTISDHPVGVFLSGGVDSSLIAGLLSKENVHKITSYTAVFDSGSTDESEVALHTAAEVGLKHKCMPVEVENVEDLLRRLVKSYGEPFGDPASLPLLAMCDQLSKENVKVVLQGDGGDELFSGYWRYQFLASKVDAVLRYVPIVILDLIPDKLLKHRLLRVLNICKQPFALKSALLLTEETMQNDPLNLFDDARQTFIEENTDPFDVYKRSVDDFSSVKNPVDRQMLIDLSIQLPTQFLTKVDRASMAAGVEARVPLLDELVIKASFSISQKLKTNWLIGKVILRKILDKVLPDNIVKYRKVGFSTPYYEWLSTDLYDRANEIVLADDFIEYFCFSRDALNELFSLERCEKDNRMFMRWKLFVLAIWFDEFMRKEN